MEKNLEKLFSNVLLNWLKCKCISDADGGASEYGRTCAYVAFVLRSCLSASGFDTDLNDFVSELAQEGERSSEKAF